MCYLVSYPRNGKTKIVDGMWDETPLTNEDMMSMEEMWMAIVAWMNMKMCGAYCPCCGKYSASAQWIEEYDSGYEASDEQDDDNDYSHSSNGSDEDDDEDRDEDDDQDDYEDDDMEEEHDEEDNNTESNEDPSYDGRHQFAFVTARERSRSPPITLSSSDNSPRRGNDNATYASMNARGRSPSPSTSTDNDAISVLTTDEEPSICNISSSSDDEDSD